MLNNFKFDTIVGMVLDDTYNCAVFEEKSVFYIPKEKGLHLMYNANARPQAKTVGNLYHKSFLCIFVYAYAKSFGVSSLFTVSVQD